MKWPSEDQSKEGKVGERLLVCKLPPINDFIEDVVMIWYSKHERVVLLSMEETTNIMEDHNQFKSMEAHDQVHLIESDA